MSEELKKQDIAGVADVVSKGQGGKETIRIEKDKFDKLLQRMERLESAASKAELAKYDSRNKGTIGKVIKLLTLDGKIITGWDAMTKNIVEKDRDGKWREEQRVNLHFADDSEEEVDLVIFHRRYQKVNATVKKETKNLEKEDIDKFGTFTFECVTDDGVRYTIGDKFIN